MKVTVYTKLGCVQCTATFKALDKHSVEYRSIDVTADANAYDYVRSLGYLQLPVVVSGDGHWSGYRPDRLVRLAPQPLTAQ
jgi:glutaredoxin-like protein NrdH